jgi:lichenan operon transcriptional antiterminator
MKSLFGDNRLANLLQLFHNTQTLSVTNMAAKLNVSDRTIRNDIKQLNQMLRGCALIDGTQGRYSLRVFDAEGFQAAAAQLSQEDDFLNSPRNRMDYLFGKLMRSDLPVITDDLAYEMSIGRTTLMGDLKKLRSELEEYQLTIMGKTSKGLTLYGSETDIRRYVLDNCFDAIYRSYPMDEEIEELIEDFFTQKRLEKVAQANFHRFTVLMLDRFLTGHYIGKMSERFYDLTARPEFGMVNALVDKIGESIANFISGFATDFTTAFVEKQQGVKLSRELKTHH